MKHLLLTFCFSFSSSCIAGPAALPLHTNLYSEITSRRLDPSIKNYRQYPHPRYGLRTFPTSAEELDLDVQDKHRLKSHVEEFPRSSQAEDSVYEFKSRSRRPAIKASFANVLNSMNGISLIGGKDGLGQTSDLGIDVKQSALIPRSLISSRAAISPKQSLVLHKDSAQAKLPASNSPVGPPKVAIKASLKQESTQGVNKPSTGLLAAVSRAGNLPNKARATNSNTSKIRNPNVFSTKASEAKTTKTTTKGQAGTSGERCSGKLQRRGQCFSQPNTNGQDRDSVQPQQQQRVPNQQRQASNQPDQRQDQQLPRYIPRIHSTPQVDRGRERSSSPSHTFEVRRPSQSPPRNLRGAKGIFDIHGPGTIATAFSDKSSRTYHIGRDGDGVPGRKTVYVSDKDQFHSTLLSWDEGKHGGSVSGGSARLFSEATGGITRAQVRGPSGFVSTVSDGLHPTNKLRASSTDRPVNPNLALPGNPVHLRFDSSGPSLNNISSASKASRMPEPETNYY